MILSVKNLSKTFVQGSHEVSALKEVSFQMEEGETLSLTGPSGSGKTTLLSLLAGLDSPTSGDLVVAGVSLKGLSEKDLSEFRAAKIGIVFQQFHLMPHLTALENVSLPLDINSIEDAQAKAQEMLSLVGLAERANHLPHQLSGGEKQRVAIARALVMKPKLILADEPSGNLDFKTGQKIMDLLFNLVGKHALSLVLVTHDVQLANRCERQINMISGSLKAEGL